MKNPHQFIGGGFALNRWFGKNLPRNNVQTLHATSEVQKPIPINQKKDPTNPKSAKPFYFHLITIIYF